MKSTKTKVGDYKGFEIYFDSDNELFSVQGYDVQKDNKKTYASCKTYIKDFIKENSLFGEFKIIKIPGGNNSSIDSNQLVTVVGIHANGNFLCLDAKGNKFQLSSSYKYDMEKWCLPKDLEASTYNASKVAELEETITNIHAQIKEEKLNLPDNCAPFLMKIKQDNSHLWK
jgi:hypothetical protein